MSPELDEQLCKKYPKIFKDRHGNMQETAMCWGFECGDGWYKLLDELCGCIQSYIDNNDHLNISQVVALQVKEKFGTLRFYTSGGNDKIDGMIWLAEYISAFTCEQCGAPGKSNSDGWIHTLCEQHHAELLKLRDK